METTPLKNFATWARKELIREVTARIAAVLAPGSSERVEQAKAVAALEKAVATAGGGDKGRAAVADKVAHTWFNRIIALRFMDANGYTGIGVVSPQAGVELGQPEILAEAKRGVIDADVVSNATRKTVVALLDGTRTSGDPQGEAYALLLESYCNHWHKAMPFMFEREGDFTELLVPANLLADDSVLNRSVKVLSEDVCQDVEVIGWLYQFYISERKDEVFAGFKKNKKAGADEIPAATQLFTPHWIVRYLVENSLGRLWMLNRPSSGLVAQMDYYIAPVDDETDFLKVTRPEELKVIDPACGSGHMLTYAFDLLYAIYEEEGYGPAEIPGLILANNLYGTEIDPRAGALAAFALTMKARGKQRAFFSKQVEPSVCVIEPISFSPDELDFLVTKDGDKYAEAAFWNQFAEADTLGSLIQPDVNLTTGLARHLESLDDGGDLLRADTLEWARKVVRQAEYLAQGYVVAIANPPYMGTRNMGTRLSSWAKVSYPTSKADLFAMFIERCMELVEPRGLVAMITMQSWMFLSTYERLRSRIEEHAPIVTMAHLGTNAFDSIGGEVVGTTSFVLGAGRNRNLSGAFVRLTDERSEESKRAALRAACRTSSGAVYRVSSAELAQVPGGPVAYWTDALLRAAFSGPSTFGSHFTPRKGNDTGDNNAFLRQWWEVSYSSIGFDMRSRDEARESGRRWFPYNKGGGFRKWYGNFDLVVDWEDDGRRIRSFVDGAGKPRSNLRNQGYYFSEGVTWSDISSSSFAARYLPPGFLCDNSGSACYGTAETLPSALAFLCSSVAYEMLMTVNPTLHFQAGNLSSLPLRVSEAEELPAMVTECIAISEEDWSLRETAWSHRASPLVSGASSSARLSERWEEWSNDRVAARARLHELEVANNHLWTREFELQGVVSESVDIEESALVRPSREADVAALVSYAVGCMFGRYSLDAPGLILADHGATLQDYLAKVPSPTFMPDTDDVIPIVDGDWFEDDIVERFRQFLRAAFGEQHFEENLRFVTESLGVKNLRDYFVKSFYKDHVQRYKKRPIYWLFSSPKGSFNALIYMHRYTPSTVSTVLNEYLREFQAKIKASLDHAERSNNAKEADRLRKILLELDEYEHDVLYPLASQNITIDLDDGVKLNYPKFGSALKKIVGLEATV
ncbi:BREX-1 system adenine-specific DNA-methyltransferase PglX [uncultured Aeromicrobium sp.]|uniref:BREX-1 system adenine-specific DNA-methyltransferase PglX n=1 Tax=uncultured Aeromicrobium sp. TaxID=337820 RepID=UPI0025FB97D1|nr:BREX-1 system adenine-specific DNA-methyltransferase PglX [uncultured Aeromicrobium sp.]